MRFAQPCFHIKYIIPEIMVYFIKYKRQIMAADGSSGGDFYASGYGLWRSATEYSAEGARSRYMYYGNENVYRDCNARVSLFSVRCVRN